MTNTTSFRDRLEMMDEKGKRRFIFPKKPSGKLYEYRKWVSYVLLAMLFSFPFLKINGNQFLMFNVLERRFNIFGFAFWPQDLYIVVIAMIAMVVFVTLFTVAFGRIFCGWVCPQTIFMEMVFRRIEYWIDGDRGAQIRLDKQEWNLEKIGKRVAKWSVFFAISFAIANVFLAYIIGSDSLLRMVTDGPASHVSNLIALLIFTVVFFFIYTRFREQVCIIACPYGRLQGVLLDNRSINVAYDFVRGEGETGRAKFRKNEERNALGKGNCIDCQLCVQVCPMGIDIRNGTQLECTNCTACIDECDAMMKNVNLPTGLIRYASEAEIENSQKFRFTARTKGYAGVLGILTAILVGLLFLRSEVEVTVLRLPGQLFEHKGHSISNVYTYRIVNKTAKKFKDLHFGLLSHKGKIETVGKSDFELKPQDIAKGTLFIQVPEVLLESDREKVRIGIFDGNVLLDSETTTFLGPRTF